MRDIKVFNEVAFANVDKNDNRYMNMKMRQSMDNPKGGNAYLVTTFTQDGKPNHFVRVGMDKAKTGPNAGSSEFERLAEASGWDAETVASVEADFDSIAAKEAGKDRIIKALDNKPMTVKGYPSKEDLEQKNSQTVYYRDYKRQIANDTLKKGDQYIENPEKRTAHFGKIEDTITPYADFDVKENDAQLKERKEMQQAAKLAGKLDNPRTEVGSPSTPSAKKESADVADIL